MNRTHLSIITALAAATGACAPLEQAPLVYSSRAQIGVGVTAGTTENPGLDINIGYKGLDAAFVPVAVAKYCRSGQTCEKVDYNIATVRGQNEVEGLSTVDEAAIDRYETDIAANSKIIQDTQPQIEARETKLANIGKLAEKRAEHDGIVPAVVDNVEQPLSQADQRQKEKLAAEIAAIEAYEAEKPTLETEVRTLKSTVEDARRKRDEAYGLLNRILARKRMQTGDSKLDAFSVYGTFNGSANGTRDGASLTAGKVFSTGVAAQNLSQGVREGSKAAATTSCLVAARSLLKDATLSDEQKKALPDRLMMLCGLEVEP